MPNPKATITKVLPIELLIIILSFIAYDPSVFLDLTLVSKHFHAIVSQNKRFFIHKVVCNQFWAAHMVGLSPSPTSGFSITHLNHIKNTKQDIIGLVRRTSWAYTLRDIDAWHLLYCAMYLLARQLSLPPILPTDPGASAKTTLLSLSHRVSTDALVRYAITQIVRTALRNLKTKEAAADITLRPHFIPSIRLLSSQATMFAVEYLALDQRRGFPCLRQVLDVPEQCTAAITAGNLALLPILHEIQQTIILLHNDIMRSCKLVNDMVSLNGFHASFPSDASDNKRLTASYSGIGFMGPLAR